VERLGGGAKLGRRLALDEVHRAEMRRAEGETMERLGGGEGRKLRGERRDAPAQDPGGARGAEEAGWTEQRHEPRAGEEQRDLGDDAFRPEPADRRAREADPA